MIAHYWHHLFFLTRVPAIVHWPDHISPGQESGLASTLDILPTVVASLGLGGSLLDNILLDGYVGKKRGKVIFYCQTPGLGLGVDFTFALTSPRQPLHLYITNLVASFKWWERGY